MPGRFARFGFGSLRPAALFRCRICWRVALIVSFCILAVETVILVPSYKNYERDLLLRLEQTGLTAISTGFRLQSHSSDRNILIAGKVLVGGPGFLGATLHHLDGKLIGTVGEAPRLTLEQV